MFNKLVIKVSATASAILIASAYEKYIPAHERHKFMDEIREGILHAAGHCVSEVMEEVREELREQILESEFSRKPGLN